MPYASQPDITQTIPYIVLWGRPLALRRHHQLCDALTYIRRTGVTQHGPAKFLMLYTKG
jgi:hypothetical protein